MPRTYRVAVIGRRGNHGHGLDVVWKALANAEVVAVADEDDKGRAAAAKRLGAKAAYADYRQMLEKERPQIVSVTDPHVDSHKDAAVACARAGASIVIEKPIARSLAQADEVVKACETHHVKLVIAHQTRYSPRVRVIRELIAAGRLGDLVEMHGRGKEDSRGAPHDHLTHACHVLDLMRLFAGEARWCLGRVLQGGRPATKADVRDEPRESVGLVTGDHITATYGFDRGVVGTWATITAADGNPARFGLVIRGTKGVVQLTTGSLPAAYFLDDPSWFPGRSKKPWQEITSNGLGKPETLTDTSLHAGNVWMVRELMAAIEADRQPSGGLYDALAALEMTLGVYESHRLNRPVELPTKERRHPLTLL